MTSTLILSAIILLLIILFVWQLTTANKLRVKQSELNTELTARNADITIATSQLNEAKVAVEKLSAEKNLLNEKLLALTAGNSKLTERLEIISLEKQRMQQEAELQFKDLASKILEEKSKKSDERLSEILNPLKQNIDNLKREITERTIKDTENHASLKTQIEMLRELNTKIGNEANNLAKALKGNNKMQGDWGEMILEQILTSSGLMKGEQFEIQVTKDENGKSITNDDGSRLRPDAIVKFPDSKQVIIDSKVSIKAYSDYVAAESEEEQKGAMSAHIASIKKHIDELASKAYQNFIKDSGEFVLMFIPNEGAYIAAMQGDNKLWEYAYNKRIVIISPTHLISVLKLVSQLWSHDKQTKNAIAIAEESGKLYDKFSNFIDDMNDISKNLNKAQTSYQSAAKRLSEGRGNIMNQIDKIKELGAKAQKSAPELTK